jgi:methylenetetrahydrofolate reductase (NADPH)
MRSVEEELDALPRAGVVAVTCSPHRGLDVTLDLAERLRQMERRVVPHFAARTVRSRDHLDEALGRTRAAGIDELFVIGGDGSEPAGPYASAADLLAAIHELGSGPERIGVGAYPDTHPHIDRGQLMEALLEKQPLASYMVTQLCFEARTIEGWLDEVRRAGVTLPVWIGIPGVLKRRKLLEISLRVGVGDSARYITKHAGIVARLMRRGDYRPDALLASLSGVVGQRRHGVAGFHLNTFNQVRTTEEWRREFLQVYGWREDEEPGDEEEPETAS